MVTDSGLGLLTSWTKKLKLIVKTEHHFNTQCKVLVIYHMQETAKIMCYDNCDVNPDSHTDSHHYGHNKMAFAVSYV